MASAHFEGPEKKLKVTFAPDAPALRALPRATWDGILAAAGASIVAAAADAFWDAYVLSESSLFVSDHSLTLITCGQTRLADAVAPLLEVAPRAGLSQVLYARKSEHFPLQQATSFAYDRAQLDALLRSHGASGSVRLGQGEHFVDLFHFAAPGVPRRPDVTVEVLMHGPDPRACEAFARTRAPEAGQAVGTVAPGFALHQHYFEPQGYSVNGLAGGAYITLHVTPEPSGSYVSFELQGPRTRVQPSDARHAVTRLAALFSPRSIEVLAYEPLRAGCRSEPATRCPPGYELCERRELDAAGYRLTFTQLRPSAAP